MTEPDGRGPEGTGGDARDRGFRERKREDHAALLIEELEASLGDPARVRRIVLELGRFYDPVLGGAIMEVAHQQRIVAAVEGGRLDEARVLIRERYDLYIKDRAHLGRRGEQ
jgi:hypothetical protein